jgi:hypothetical protein
VVEVVGTTEFEEWFLGLDDQAAQAVDLVVGLLESLGVRLGFPYSSAINGATFALRELRAQSGGRPIRVFYAFDPKRQAVLLIGGDKTGDTRFYGRTIPIAERIWRTYLEETNG